MISRRGFMGATVPLWAAGQRYAPVLAVQTYVWSQHFARQKQLVRDHLEDIIGGCAEAGFRNIELTGDYFAADAASETIGLLKKYKFTMPVVYNGGIMHDEAEAAKMIARSIEIVERAKGCGLKALNTNPNPKPKRERKTDAELAVQARTINRLADEMGKRGIRLFVHQHDPEMMENAREWRYVLKNTDPKRVEFCLDTHWVYRGGQDVMTLLAECAPRLGAVHLRNSKKGVWLEEFGDGDIDYRQVAAYLKKIGFRGYLVVELAYDKDTVIKRPLVDSLRLSRKYAEEVFGVKA